jgi:transposase InsO family protein
MAQPVLAIFHPDHQCILHTDASQDAIGAILFQRDGDKEKVVAYYSRRLNIHERRYTVTEQECLAVVDSVEKFHIYLHGKQFDVISDHSALQWLSSRRKPSGRLFRWSIRLSIYDYVVKHRKGSEHCAADALSRSFSMTLFSTEELQKFQSELSELHYPNHTISDGVMKVKHNNKILIVVPESLRDKVLYHIHDQHGHPAYSKTKRMVSLSYWWKNMFSDIKSYVQRCHTCQIVKDAPHPTIGKQQPIQTPQEPNILWAIDTIVLGSAANNTHAKNIQVVIDHHSRFIWAFATPRSTASTIINIFSQLFKSVGSPQLVISDNATVFTSKELKRFMDQKGVRLSRITPYHPQANGLCEKSTHTIMVRLRIACHENPKKRWSSLLDQIIQQYNDTIHDATGFSPRYLQFAISSLSESINVHEARKLAAQQSDKQKDSRKHSFDIKHPECLLKIGDLVTRKIASNHPKKNKLSPLNEGPFEIIDQVGTNTFILRTGQSISQAHSSHLRPYVAGSRINQGESEGEHESSSTIVYQYIGLAQQSPSSDSHLALQGIN